MKQEAADRLALCRLVGGTPPQPASQSPGNSNALSSDLDLLQLQTASGFTAEDLDLVIQDMAGAAKEPTYCMGDDIPLAVLSTKPHLLYDYFKQRFAQVTNPPIDPLREKLVMSLEMYLGPRGSVLRPEPSCADVLHLSTPVLNEAELQALATQGLATTNLSTLFAVRMGPMAWQKAIDVLRGAAEAAVRGRQSDPCAHRPCRGEHQPRHHGHPPLARRWLCPPSPVEAWASACVVRSLWRPLSAGVPITWPA